MWSARSSLSALLAPFAVGLTAFGHGPPWMVLVWGLGLWAARSSETARRASVTMPLVLALVGAVRAWPDGLALTALYVHLALVGLALHFALDALEEGAKRGLLYLAAVWLFAPSAPGLLGLWLAGATFGEVTQRGVRRVTSRSAPLALLGAAALAVALAFALPRPAPLAFGEAPPPAAETTAPSGGERSVRPAPPGGAGRRAPKSAQPLSAPQDTRARVTYALLSLLLFLLAVVLALAGWRLWRERAHKLGRAHWSDVLAVLGVLIGAAMVLLYALLRTGGGLGGGPGSRAPSGAGGAGEAAASPANDFLAWAFGALGWLSLFGLVAACALLAALAVLILRAKWDGDESGPRGPCAPAGSEALPAALHRVRAAYRALLSSLAAAGVARAPQETPQELAARAGVVFPGLRQDIETLTALYQPVRYGGQVTEEHAEHAEQALARVQAELRASPDAANTTLKELPS